MVKSLENCLEGLRTKGKKKKAMFEKEYFTFH